MLWRQQSIEDATADFDDNTKEFVSWLVTSDLKTDIFGPSVTIDQSVHHYSYHYHLHHLHRLSSR